jgi:RimJ/RimL family protein N-acetyltransferase
VGAALNRPVVVLRPFRPEEVDRLWAVRASEIDAGLRRGPASRAEVATRVAGSGTWTDTEAGLVFAVEADGGLTGEIQARRAQGMLPTGVVEIGIDLFEAVDRGRGIGRAAVALLTARLFDAGDAHRVQLSTDVSNTAMRTVAERLGFTFEGILRGFMPTDQGRRDYAQYAMTIDDYREVKTTWISTS